MFINCASGKQGFPSAAAANRIARSMNNFYRRKNRKATGHAPARVYECEQCGNYHLTGAKDMKKIKVKYVPSETKVKVRVINDEED